MPNVQLDAPNDITLPAAELPISVTAKSEQDLATWALLPDDDNNAGRALRCRMMSFLC
jgi:hypothetical protein